MEALPFVFKALSDRTRLRLLNLTAEREICVCFLCDVLKTVQPKVSRHLAYLKRAGLVTARREGKWMHYGWAHQTDPVARNLMAGLRDWMMKDAAMTADRETLKKSCCR